MEVDFLLIGQGLAGSVLSYRLVKAGYKVHVLDTPEANNSSRVAAGLYNPVTGRKMVKTWNADLLFPLIEPFYGEMERDLGASFLYKRPIYRPFVSYGEQNEWMANSGDPDFAPYIEEVKTKHFYKELNDPYGGVLLKMCGFLDVNALLDAHSHWLLQKGFLTKEKMDENKLVVEENQIKYKALTAEALVYANGLGAMESRYFHWLPFAPVKGEILLLKQKFAPYEIINRGVFRISMGKETVRVGSTYSKDDLRTGPSERAKKEILEKLKKVIDLPIQEILEHNTGVRPAIRDRRPVLGKHPKHENVYIFNGLGAKGVSLAPYFSEEMYNLLILGQEPHKDVNISRFFKYI